MMAKTRATRLGQRRRNARGFTLVELMVAMVIASILIALIFAVYTRMSVAYQAQNRITEIMQNLRAGQERIIRELRMVGDQLPQPDYRPTADDDRRFFDNTYATGKSLTMQRASDVNFNGISIAGTEDPFGHGAGAPIQPIYITNGGGTQPDQVRFFYADRGVAAKIVETPTFVVTDPMVLTLVDHNTIDTVSPVDQFEDGDFVVLVNSTQEEISMDVTGDSVPDVFETTAYEACLLRISTRDNTPTVNTITFASGTSLHNASNTLATGGAAIHHCEDVLRQHNADMGRPAAARADTMLYRLVGRAYRIDPARREVGVLQVSESGELVPNDWQDLGIGFTNLQFATQWFENGDPNNQDGDLLGDLNFEWYSGENQEFLDTSVPIGQQRPQTAVMVRINMSLETRSFSQVDGVPTSSIPGYIGPDPDNNLRGDSPTISLSPTLPADARYSAPNIYRWITTSIDFRNMGRGR